MSKLLSAVEAAVAGTLIGSRERSSAPEKRATRSLPSPAINVQAVAEAALGRIRQLEASGPGATVSVPAKPRTIAELKVDLVARWNSDALTRNQFGGSFGAYEAFRNHEFCIENHLSAEAFKQLSVDVEAHVAKINGARKSRGEPELDSSKIAEITARAKVWETNPELRAEFGSFGAYDSYQQWHAAGRVKIYGSAVR